MKVAITEQIYPNSKTIDNLSLKQAIELMVFEHKKGADILNELIPFLELTVNQIVKQIKLSKLSRIIYVGAGTSGRIGVQDGIELYPTFGWPRERLVFLIAGGIEALYKPIENAEDDEIQAEKIFLKNKINNFDIVFGLAASGNTPFTCKIMELSKKVNALTISISNNPYGKILDYGEIKLILNTKQELLAGSTRLKAGTSQKICLNIISTMVMTKLGFVKDGKMSNLVATNKKLKRREKLIQNEIKNK